MEETQLLSVIFGSLRDYPQGGLHKEVVHARGAAPKIKVKSPPNAPETQEIATTQVRRAG